MGRAHDSLVALTDDGFRIGRPLRDGEEAAVLIEDCAWTWAAVGGGRGEFDPCVVEVERFAIEQLGEALCDQLVA